MSEQLTRGARDAGELAAPQSTMGSAMVARELGIINALFQRAQMFPRNEQDVEAELMKECKRPAFAEKARYRFPRGGGSVEGPSVNLARTAARLWGNLYYGARTTDMNAQTFTVEGYAYDMQTGAFHNKGMAAKNLILRTKPSKEYGGKTGWLQPNERDSGELQMRVSAKAERNAILEVLPRDMIDRLLDQVKKTLAAESGKGMAKDKDAFLRLMVQAFRDVGVTGKQLEAWSGAKLDLITHDQVADLKGILKAIQDGEGKREEYFDMPAPKKAASRGSGKGKDKPETVDESTTTRGTAEDGLQAIVDQMSPGAKTKTDRPAPPKDASGDGHWEDPGDGDDGRTPSGRRRAPRSSSSGDKDSEKSGLFPIDDPD